MRFLHCQLGPTLTPAGAATFGRPTPRHTMASTGSITRHPPLAASIRPLAWRPAQPVCPAPLLTPEHLSTPRLTAPAPTPLIQLQSSMHQATPGWPSAHIPAAFRLCPSTTLPAFQPVQPVLSWLTIPPEP